MFAGLYAKLIIAAIIVALVLGGVWYVRNLQNEVQTLTTEKALLESKIVEQNAGIDALKKEADERLKAGEAAVAAAKEETKKAKGKATIIYKTKPSTPGDDCKSALDLINDAGAAEKKALELVNGGKK